MEGIMKMMNFLGSSMKDEAGGENTTEEDLKAAENAFKNLMKAE